MQKQNNEIDSLNLLEIQTKVFLNKCTEIDRLIEERRTQNNSKRGLI